MRLCKVIGNVTASVKHHTYNGLPLMIVQPLDGTSMAERGASLLAVDTVQAGPGDQVLVMSEGSGVRQILKTSPTSSPIRSVIVGIVDAVTVDEGGES
ncbi:MAG: EutN/CcmL family microcompartment protein [Myxococcales bacterium]|nr:EutN/CcmL family microcompartment protein [Myxococcales bacterium]